MADRGLGVYSLGARANALAARADELAMSQLLQSSKKALWALCSAALLLSPVACGPKAVRGGPGTARPALDNRALSTTLDREDVQYLVEQNLKALQASPFWAQDIQQSAAGRTLMAIWPIQNESPEHLESELDQILGSIETFLVNDPKVAVVSRERQSELAQEVGVQQGAAFNSAAAATMGRQLGAKYYFTGKVTATQERLKRRRRVQYTLFMQVLQVETGLVMFQHESIRSKEIR